MSDELTDDSDASRPTRRESSPQNSSTPSNRNSSNRSRRNSSSSLRTSTVPTRRDEFDFIERIRRQELRRLGRHNTSSLITQHSSLLTGSGDDAAVVGQRAGFDM